MRSGQGWFDPTHSFLSRKSSLPPTLVTSQRALVLRSSQCSLPLGTYTLWGPFCSVLHRPGYPLPGCPPRAICTEICTRTVDSSGDLVVRGIVQKELPHINAHKSNPHAGLSLFTDVSFWKCAWSPPWCLSSLPSFPIPPPHHLLPQTMPQGLQILLLSFFK